MDASLVTTTRRGGRSLALTFDDGPNPSDTPRLLEVLRSHGVRATFCLVGDQVRAHPGIARAIVRDGHVLGNHTMHHDDLSTMSPEQVRADLLETTATLREAVPDVAVPWFRAPFGAWGSSPQIAVELGMRPLGWSLEITDWEPPGADVLAERLRRGIRPGGVVLLHDGGGDRSQTVSAVEQVLPELSRQGWHLDLPARPVRGGCADRPAGQPSSRSAAQATSAASAPTSIRYGPGRSDH